MDFQPLDDRIVVKQDPMVTHQGVILLPDPQEPLQGTVIACGPGKLLRSGNRLPLDVKPGDRIMYGRYANDKIFSQGENTYIFMREADVVGVLDA